MIRLPSKELPAAIQAKLNEYQARVDRLPSFQKRVAKAEKQFKNCNTAKNKTFKVIRQTLSEMCSGARRCCYCEDSAADEVEHIRPKSLYPEQVFAWENYLYACGPCNGPKNNQFAVLSRSKLITLSSDPKRTKPYSKRYALIDPRVENPLDFLYLDLAGTFYFLPYADEGTIEYVRAQYTIDILRLNARDYLPAARRNAYGSYKSRLVEYRQIKISEPNSPKLANLIHGIQTMPHPSVWAEMKRQATKLSELIPLFELIPEAADW